MSPKMIESTDGVRVALHDLGGEGPPLLFLHATGFHGRCYGAIADRLHTRFRVWAPDLRGHGGAETPDMALPWRGMVDDAMAVLAHLEIDEPVAVCGHSMGGNVALQLELRRPTTVARAWVYEPIVFPTEAPTSRANPMAAAARQRRADFADLDDALLHYTGRGPFAAVEPRVLRDYVHHGFRPTDDGVTLATTPENEARTFEGIDLSVFDRLGDVAPEVTVVASGDGGPPATMAPMVTARLPRGTLRSWPDRSHFGPFEDPARAAEEILEALG